MPEAVVVVFMTFVTISMFTLLAISSSLNRIGFIESYPSYHSDTHFVMTTATIITTYYY